MTLLTLAEANSIIGAALEKARQLDLKIAVAVCDPQGRVIAFNRMDGAFETVDRLALGKAVVSAGTGLPSGEVVHAPDHPLVATAVGEGLPLTRVEGGLPIFARTGELAGGCGVAGAPLNEQDEQCARAGISGLAHFNRSRPAS